VPPSARVKCNSINRDGKMHSVRRQIGAPADRIAYRSRDMVMVASSREVHHGSEVFWIKR
jgi:hypothetical protein